MAEKWSEWECKVTKASDPRVRVAAIRLIFEVSSPPPEPGPFSGSRLKVIRAKQHIYELTRLIESHQNSNQPTLEFDPNQVRSDGKRIAHLTVRAIALPQMASAVAGDAIHNLRSALDLLAVRLVELNGEVSDNVSFPFSESAASFQRALRQKNFNLASTEDQAEVARLAPYKGGNELLRALHDLDVLDKHRKLIPDGSIVQSPNAGPAHDEHGDPVGWDDDDLRMEVVPGTKAAISYTFPEGEPLGKRPLLETLRELVQVVVEIIDRFEKLHGRTA